MKICLGSDLHLEFNGQKELPILPEHDVLVLAGDIGKGVRVQEFQQLTTKPILFVPGNHEFYGYQFDGLNGLYQSIRESTDHESLGPLTCLSPGFIEIGDTLFIGATLWTSLRLYGYKNFPGSAYEKAISDFYYIKYSGDRWTAEHHIAANKRDVEFIANALQEFEDRKIVVITHFLPSQQCIDPFFKNSNINPYFCNDLDALINMYKPEAWLFGHTHSKVDKLHSNGITKLICNPRGYPNEKKSFKWKEIEI